MRLRIALLLLIALSPLVTTRTSGAPTVGQDVQPQLARTTALPESSLSFPASGMVDESGPGEATGPAATMLNAPAADRERGPTANAALAPDPGWEAIMTEDFEGVFPPPGGKWTVEGHDGWGNEVYWDDDDYLAHSGNWSAYCARGGAFGVDPGYYLFHGYPMGMYTTMTYGPFDLRDATVARLTFYEWSQLELSHDWFWLAVAVNAPTNIVGKYTVSASSGGWTPWYLDLMTIPGVRDALPDGPFYIQFGFQSDFSNPQAYLGTFVDDIVLEKGLPNLVPYKPDGWDYPIVPSSVTGTNSVNALYVDQPTYIDWAVARTGTGPAATLHTCLYLDGSQIYCWWDPYESGMYVVQDWPITVPTAGPHTLKIVADAYNELAESNENDNAWEMTFTWLPALPGVFNKSSPAPEATGQPTNPGLIWRPSSGATSYEYCYDTTDDNNCDGSWKSSGGRAGASLSGLSPGTTYYWQVRAVNAGGVTYADGGAWWNFTTQVSQPGAFGKSGPVNGATGQPTSPNLSWGSSAGATSYEYCVSTSASCAGNWTSAGSNTSANVSGLTKGMTYYWQVRAKNTAGTTEADNGIWWSFATAQVDLPAGFSKTIPANEATGQPTNLTLSWSSSSGATSYEYCYDTSGDNSCSGSWTSTGSKPSANPAGFSTGMTYYWQVRALNDSGTTEGNGGAWWSFTTSAEPSNEWLVYLPLSFRSYSGGGW